MRRLLIAVVSIATVALATRAAVAQAWSGSEGLEVRVEDAKGKSVAGAEVALAPESAGAGIAFAPVVTDGRGRAAIGALAAGSWRLEVRKPGFMTYAAEVVLSGGKPAITSATHRNVPGATSTLRVRIGRAASAPPLRQVASAVAATPPAPVAPPPAAEVGSRAVSEVAVPARPAPPATTVPPAAAHPLTMSGQAPSPQPSTVAAMAPPPIASPLPVAPPPPAAPAAPVMRPQAAPPAPAAPPIPPPVAPRAVVAKDVVVRSCFECRPGETARALDVTTSDGGGSCPADLRARLQAAPTEAWREIAAALPAGCALLEIEISSTDRYIGFRYEASSPRGRVEDCRPGRDCTAGGCRFLGEPLLRSAGGRTLVAAVFESAAERSASFVVYTRPAR